MRIYNPTFGQSATSAEKVSLKPSEVQQVPATEGEVVAAAEEGKIV